MKMGMEKVSEAILDKVKAEAQDIIKDAEEKARERLEKAKEQHEAKFEKEKSRLMEEAEAEAARAHAQASIMARQELLIVKNEVIEDIVSRVRKALSKSSGGTDLSLDLIKEAIDTTDADEVIVYVSPADIAGVQKLVKEDKKLAGRIKEIKEYKCAGGAIVEDIDAKVSIDNTYDTRLETLLPQILPEINKELFGK
jgi:vacuolar-type H+-ATPase subunit E/Vma4